MKSSAVQNSFSKRTGWIRMCAVLTGIGLIGGSGSIYFLDNGELPSKISSEAVLANHSAVATASESAECSEEIPRELVTEWRDRPATNSTEVEGIYLDEDGRRIHFTADETADGRWKMKREAFLGEYVVKTTALPMEMLHRSGLIEEGFVIIERSNRFISHVRFDVATLEGADWAQAWIESLVQPGDFDANTLVYASGTPNDPAYTDSWTLQKLDLEPVWEAFGFAPDAEQGRQAVIAVIDNGAPADGDFLLWVNADEIPGNGIDDDGNGYIDDVHGYNFSRYNSDLSYAGGHGSQVAKIAAGLTNNGVGSCSPASSAALMRVLYHEAATGGLFAALDAIIYAAQNGADVINCSFISKSGSMFSYVLNMIEPEGAIVVAAAGNGGSNLDTNASYPVYLENENLIGVGASNAEDLRGNSSYSATRVDLFAPGSATSFSTPLVSSTVALLRTLKPDATIAEIKEALIRGAEVNPGLTGLCVSNGRLNVRKAVEELLDIDLSELPPLDPEGDTGS
jgi:thermitase